MAQNFIHKSTVILCSITKGISKICQLERELWLAEVLQKHQSSIIHSFIFIHSLMSENDKNVPLIVFFFFFFFFYELKLMYICLFTRAKSGREMTDCILSLPLMTVTDKHLCNISSKKEEKILQSFR